MQSNEPSQSVQPIIGDHRAWPARTEARHAPYGVSLNAGELLTRAWTAWRDDAGRLIGITAIPYALMMGVVVMGVIGVVASGFDIDHLDDSGPFIGLAIGGGLGLFISIMLLFVAAAAGTFLVVEERLRGESKGLTAVGAILAGLSSLGRLMVSYAVIGGGMTVLLAPVMALGFYAITAESFAIGGAAIALLFPVGIAAFIASMRLFAVGPIVVIEDVGAFEGIRRSWAMTRGNFGDIFVAFLVFGAIMIGINMATSILGIIPIVGALVQLAAGVVIGSLQSVYIFLVYAALRDKQG